MIRLTRGGPLHLGVNYRLAYGWDFAHSDLSLANPARLALARADFARLSEVNATILRWFLFTDGRTVMSPNGPLPFNATALQSGLDAAREHGLSVLLVLLDHTFAFREEQAGASVKQGYGRWLKDPNLFEKLSAELLLPAIEVAAAHPAVMGFELINEPEMAMRRRDGWIGASTGVGCPQVDPQHQLTVNEMRGRMAPIAAFVHQQNKQFSVGSMSSRWVAQWEPVLDPDRDFLNFHYYGERHERDLNEMLEARILPLAARIPIGFGEFYPRGCECIPPSRVDDPWPDHSLTDFFSAAARHNLQLAMPWVWNPGENDPGDIPVEEWSRYNASR